MNHSEVRRVGVALVALACAAGSASAQQTDRSKKPALAAVPQLKLPALHQFTLPNGLKVVLMEKHDVPLVQLNLIVNAGSVADPSGTGNGVASITADLLDEGAAGKNALQLADAFEALGARFSVAGGLHTSTASLRVSVPRLNEAVKLMSDVIMRPDFPAAELERLRKERTTALISMHDQPGVIAGAVFSTTLFGKAHPYSRSGFGDEASLRALSMDQVRAFYAAQYRPNNATLIVVGDVSVRAAGAAIEAAFGSWTRGDVKSPDLASAPQVSGRTIYIVDKPGAAQSVIRFGRIGVPRNTQDYFALEVLNTILGGSFTSRLNQNLREKNGYAYGANSGFDYRPIAGPWSASSNVQTKSTGPALTEFMKELRAIREPIPQEEIDRARNFLAMRFPAGFQSVGAIAGRLAELVSYNLPPDYYNQYTHRVLAVTKADVERVARQYIDPDNVTVFIVGDRKSIEQQVRDANLGEIRFLEVTDVLGPIPK